MTNTKGFRRGTRYMFARDFRKHGPIPLSTYMKIYKRGDYVDIKATGAVQKGMPHKFYHGRTGRVFEVSPHAVGVLVSKRVRNRIIEKRIYIRIEHVKPSRCREEFVKRCKLNIEHKKNKQFSKLKRKPQGPKEAMYVRTKGKVPELLQPLPYELIV
ncbi:hypothetical protein GJ496_008974 [Pomphorhynchus laevis]|nr:hypothetical protein GJ496_008974 [Pomphorhynchus laevis]